MCSKRKYLNKTKTKQKSKKTSKSIIVEYKHVSPQHSEPSIKINIKDITIKSKLLYVVA